jgi:hypothetical protein
MMAPEQGRRRRRGTGRVNGISLRRIGRYGIAARGVRRDQDQVKAMMGRALQRWLDSHGLLAIAGAVLGIALALSVTMVAVGYLVAR